jgi:riboflavin kinase/FMN adenylyltransferase
VIVVQGINRLEPAHGRLFVVLGVFDGLHLGHLYMLRELAAAAAARDARPAVITFDHHPDEILAGSAPPLLCDPAERLQRLAAAGVELTVVDHFDVNTRMTPYDAYVRRIAERVDLAGFLMTHESAFGFERRGTPETVAALGRDLGYDVVVVPTLELGDRPVRSAEIRSAIAAGDLAAAATLLGRRYAVVGTAEPVGNGVQLTFAMPVALPPAGSYAVRVASLADGAPASGAGLADADAELEATIGDGRILISRAHLGPGKARVVFA